METLILINEELSGSTEALAAQFELQKSSIQTLEIANQQLTSQISELEIAKDCQSQDIITFQQELAQAAEALNSSVQEKMMIQSEAEKMKTQIEELELSQTNHSRKITELENANLELNQEKELLDCKFAELKIAHSQIEEQKLILETGF